SALLARAGLATVDKQNEYNSLSLLEMARSSVKEKAYNRLQTVANAFTHSTSDFPLILENIANKSLLRGYEEAPETFTQWTSTGTLSDFKTSTRVGLGAYPNLQEVPEGAEYKR